MPALRFRRRTLSIGAHHIRLRTLLNSQQFADPQGEAAELGISSASWPLFGVVWPAGEALAQLMVTEDIADRHILEVGCGIGLASLLLNHRHADVSATDYHPCAAAFLRHNVSLNQGRDIPFLRTDWRDGATRLGKFDLIIGSDLLYERDQAALLARFVDDHALPTAEVIITDPGRGNTGRFSTLMANGGYSNSPISVDGLSHPFAGKALRFSRTAIA